MSAVEGWKKESLSRVAQINMGQSPDSKYYSEEKNGLPFLQGCAEFTGRFPKNVLYCSQTKKVALAGSILFSVRAPVGKINVADQDYIIGRGLAAISGVDVDQTYLEHYLKYEASSFRNASQGSTFEAINSSELNKWPIEYPTSKPEQAKIAEILSTVDRAIEQTEALIAKQQRIKTGLMQDLLTRGIDEHGNLRTEQTHKFKDSPLGRIPVEWANPLIGNIAVHVGSGVTPRGGETVYTKEGILFIRSQNVHFGGLHLSDVSYISQRIHDTMRRSEVFENDVLLNITGASIGRCCAMPKINCPANVNQHVCAIRLDQATQSDAGFLVAVIESSIGQNQILKFNAGGNREGLNYEQVKSFVLPWPEVEERQRSHALIKEAEETLEMSRLNLEKLRSIKTGLMQDLLTGSVRFSEEIKLNKEEINV